MGVITRIANPHQQRGLKRFLFCLAFWFVVTQCDFEWVFESVNNYFESKELKEVQEENGDNHQLQAGSKNSDEDEDEQMRLFLLISEQCLPKLVCELYSKPFDASFTDSEKSLMGLIGSSWMGAVKPSKYHYAAHFGQLIQGYEGQGCHNMYPMCPFSGEDVQQIARKIPLK